VDAILQREQRDRVHKVALLVFAFITGGAAFAGALIGSSGLMLLGGVVGTCVGVIAMFKLGYACFSKQDQREAESLADDLRELNQLPPSHAVYT
jgi:hypothetical protein